MICESTTVALLAFPFWTALYGHCQPFPCSGSTIVVSSSAPAESSLASSDDERLPGIVFDQHLRGLGLGLRKRAVTVQARSPVTMMAVEARHLDALGTQSVTSSLSSKASREVYVYIWTSRRFGGMTQGCDETLHTTVPQVETGFESRSRGGAGCEKYFVLVCRRRSFANPRGNRFSSSLTSESRKSSQ